MQSPLSSGSPESELPLGPPICKITYLDRQKTKRKRTVSNQADSESDSSSKSKAIMSSMKASDSPKKTPFKTPASKSKAPKKVDVDLPGPSPKRARRDSDESTISTKVKKSNHIRSNSSISSLHRVVSKSGNASSATKKPASARKPQSKARSVAAEDDVDDNASIADSTISTKVRRNETERVQYFENQPECGEMEPHHVQCLRCGKSVNLGRKQTYAVRPWEIHRAGCDQKPAVNIVSPPSTPVEEAAAGSPVLESPGPQATAPAAPASPSPSTPYVARRQTEAERRAYLESDKQAEIVEKDRVSCRKCQKWITLSDKQAYTTGNWVKHKIRCSDIVPSNRVAAAKRKLLVVNDSQAKSFDARKIECAFCGTNVTLEGEGDYDLTCWEKHKSRCTRSMPIGRRDSVSSIAFPSRYPRPPPSNSSSQGTLIASEAGPSNSLHGLKRGREETETLAAEDERPAARPRTESYVPPDQESPSGFGWFLLPFHAFARGFRESLKNSGS
ncbi:hypothetical protein B0H34DRAFT_405990 [Crassisporium funariophilum]|nr:hypothetical protein B0H34DRAFT_405990 [Crassisporium funariophilum]